MPEDTEGQPNGRPYEVEYDEAEMGDAVSREEFDNDPNWAQAKFSKLAYQRKLERARADKAEGRAQALQEQYEQTQRRLQDLESKFNSSPLAEKPKEGIEGITDGQLREYKDRAMGWMQRAAADPSDDAAKAEMAKIDFSKLSLIDQELARRAALVPVRDLEQRITQNEQVKGAQQALTNRLRMKYGDEVLDLRSPLMQRAAEIAKEMVTDYGLPSLDAGASIAAVDRAHKELRGRNAPGREMSESDRRRLSMEAGARSQAPVSRNVDALREKGDWKGVVKENWNQLDGFFDGMGLPR